MKDTKIKITKKLIRSIVENTINKITPQKVILFGSYAYEKPYRDSDVDLLFIKETKLSALKRYCWVNSNIEHLFPMDILVKTPSEIKRRLDIGDPFYRNIMKKGKVLYESPK